MIHQSVSVLLTCHNRREKTLSCLDCLYRQKYVEIIEMEFFLVDDGSIDGTSDEVKSKYPKVNIITGDGNLYWAGGMRLAWETALKSGTFDYYWLVNDDTYIYEDTLRNLLKADEYSLKEFGKQGIYVGSTINPVTKEYSYGGQKLDLIDNYSSKRVFPNGSYQSCHFCNANILLVTASVAEKIGILCKKYIHSIADYDYSMQAFYAGFPLLVLPSYCGECLNDYNNNYKLQSLNIIKRIQYLYSPKGFSYKEFLYFVRKFFPSTYMNTVLTLWIRTLFPVLWAKYKASKK